MKNTSDLPTTVFVMDIETNEVIASHAIWAEQGFEPMAKWCLEMADGINEQDPDNPCGCFLYDDGEIYSLQREDVERIANNIRQVKKEIAEGNALTWTPGMFLKAEDK